MPPFLVITEKRLSDVQHLTLKYKRPHKESSFSISLSFNLLLIYSPIIPLY